jgi:UDP-glucose 4-epimerase
MVLTTVAVTGASGMLGRHIVFRLQEVGFDVVCFSSKTNNLNTWKYWDLNHWKSIEEFDKLLSCIDVVVHAGAIVPNTSDAHSKSELFDVNIVATLNISQWCRKRKVPLIFISGAIVYIDPYKKDIKENSLRGLNDLGDIYGLSKLLAENILFKEENAGLTLSIIRPSSIYGYGINADKLVCSFLDTASKGCKIKICEPTSDSIDFIHAKDVSSVIEKIITKKAWGTFNVSSGISVSIKELAEQCVLATGHGSIVITSEKEYRIPHARFNINSDRAKKVLGWSPQVNISQGLHSIFNEQVI